MTEETKGVQRERTSAASLHLPPSLSFTYLLSLSPKSSKVGDPWHESHYHGAGEGEGKPKSTRPQEDLSQKPSRERGATAARTFPS